MSFFIFVCIYIVIVQRAIHVALSTISFYFVFESSGILLDRTKQRRDVFFCAKLLLVINDFIQISGIVEVKLQYDGL